MAMHATFWPEAAVTFAAPCDGAYPSTVWSGLDGYLNVYIQHVGWFSVGSPSIPSDLNQLAQQTKYYTQCSDALLLGVPRKDWPADIQMVMGCFQQVESTAGDLHSAVLTVGEEELNSLPCEFLVENFLNIFRLVKLKECETWKRLGQIMLLLSRTIEEKKRIIGAMNRLDVLDSSMCSYALQQAIAMMKSDADFDAYMRSVFGSYMGKHDLINMMLGKASHRLMIEYFKYLMDGQDTLIRIICDKVLQNLILERLATDKYAYKCIVQLLQSPDAGALRMHCAKVFDSIATDEFGNYVMQAALTYNDNIEVWIDVKTHIMLHVKYFVEHKFGRHVTEAWYKNRLRFDRQVDDFIEAVTKANCNQMRKNFLDRAEDMTILQ